MPARTRVALCAGLLLALACGLLPLVDVVERLELRTHDLRFLARGPRRPAHPVVLALVTDDTLKEWPEPRAAWPVHYARAVLRARDAGARAVGLDLLHGTDTDEYLERVWTEAMRLARPGRPLTGPELQRLYDSPELQPESAFARGVAEAGLPVVMADTRDGAGLTPRMREMVREAVRLGFVNAGKPVADSLARRIPLEARGPAGREPSFTAQLAAAAGTVLPPGQAEAGDAHRYLWINYVDLIPQRGFPRVPLHRLAAGALTPEEQRQLRGAVVLFGEDFTGMGDIHSGPGDVEFPGVEIQAHALSSLLDGCALRRPPAWAFGAACVLAGLVGAAAAAGVPPLTGSLLTAAVGAAWWALSLRAFGAGHALLPVFAPLSALALTFLGSHLAGGLADRAERARIERVFGLYTTPRLRDYLLASPENQRPGGREVEATVLFFDIRDSVRRAAGRSPAEVMGELNAFFAAVVPLIQDHEGLLFRYTGDGFLAVFGAPFPLEDHAASAVRAARGIAGAVAAINAKRLRGAEPWRFGCGIHTGWLVAGNLGTDERPEFTVIGDTVNLAARLQEQARDLRAEIVVSEATYRAAGVPDGRGPVLCAVKGREEPVAVYCVGSAVPAAV